jgi:hypothetical protein
METLKREACLYHAPWYINLDSRPTAQPSLTIAVTTGPKNARILVVSVTVKVAELLARAKDRANGKHGKLSQPVLLPK